MQKVLIIGGTTFDHVVYLSKLPAPIPQTIHAAPFNEGTGSTGSGKALNLTRLGVDNTLYSVLGDDIYGRHIIDDLRSNGVDFFYDLDPTGTERHINIMDAEGARISMFITQSSDNINHSVDKIIKEIEAANLIVLNIINYCKNIIPLLSKYDKPVWTDLHDYDGNNSYHDVFINASQYIHLSSDNLKNDYTKVMQHLIENGKELVICTHGKAGASLLTKEGEWIDQPAILNYPMVDANGAGDSFFAGFLYGWIKKEPLLTCMQMGTICAGLCIGSKKIASELISEANLYFELTKQFQQ
jgi:sugar/nucleoside kinase (ribokinase family)